MTQIKITQADRDRAAKFTQDIGARSRGERAAILNGHADDDCYVQAFAAHRIAAEQQTQWQDISTARKDGTEVLVYVRRKVIRLGWYFAPSSRTFGWRDENGEMIKPTHWMPLPPAPTTIEEQGAPA